MENITSGQYDEVIENCKNLFLNKMKDYGTAWRVLRASSLTDQIYIKANRIRSIDSKGSQKIEEGIEPEFIGIVNYSIIALIQLELGDKIILPDTFDELEMPAEQVEEKYGHYAMKAKSLMQDKNHDYGEAWRNMRISSLTDIILMKLFRIKQIEDNKGETVVSEGVDANFYDIINYAVFALIKILETK
ncbi:MAG: DUF1599 domain-containing protein [Bacteroidales bacterium]|nr:DUF1599 domain-containing protein [Bacteroidales bacterium]MCF8398502.1 DUF1599 domain-containing protein [Bacteroidales bacterium]